jgi:RNA polymerase sigma-70 factor (ECF subfamily)
VAEGTIKSRCARGRVKLAVLLGHLREDGGADGTGPVEAARNRPAPPRVGAGDVRVGEEGS